MYANEKTIEALGAARAPRLLHWTPGQRDTLARELRASRAAGRVPIVRWSTVARCFVWCP